MFYQQHVPLSLNEEIVGLLHCKVALASMVSLHLVHLSDIAALLVGAACAFLLTFGLTFVVKAFCRRVGWLDKPESRRIHKRPVPRLGGVGIFLAFALASSLFYSPGSAKETVIYWLLLVASLLIVLVHAYDDVRGLKPLVRLVAQTVAVIIVLGPFGSMFHGVLLFGFSNPFGHIVDHPGLPWYLKPELTLFIHQPIVSLVAIPAVLFTWFWMVGMMNTVNLIDGMDGLATGWLRSQVFLLPSLESVRDSIKTRW